MSDAVGHVERNGFHVVIARAMIFAIFLLVLSLIGELLISWGVHRPFTSVWAFGFSSLMLGTFPFTYLGVPLGYGLSVFSKSRATIPMTRALRFLVFAVFLALVGLLVAASHTFLRYSNLQLDLEYWLYFPSCYLLTSFVTMIQNRRII